MLSLYRHSLYVITIVLLGTASCLRQKENVQDIGQVRFDPADILISDPDNNKIDAAKNGITTDLRTDTAGKGTYHLKFTISTGKPIEIRNLELRLRYKADRKGGAEAVKKSFHWIPNLKLDKGDIISQHVFRSPAIILTNNKNAVAVIPDPVAMQAIPGIPYFMDISFTEDDVLVSFGLSKYRTKNHVYYEHSDSSFILPGKTELSLFLVYSDSASPLEILEKTNSFIWDRFARPYTGSLLPQVLPFRLYARAGYDMGLDKYWVNGPVPNTGGITLSTFRDPVTKVYRGREYKDDLWFHSWFNNARTAYGLCLWGKETGNQLWESKALSVMKLLLRSPQHDGFFSTIWVPEKNDWVASGQGGGPDLYHVPDNAWTAIWLLRFSDELQELAGADRFLNDFAKGLLKTQLPNGSFPARIRITDLSADTIMMNSASGALATWFLEEMTSRKKFDPETDSKARVAIWKSLSFLEKEILPERKFQDYEVFFSCAPNPLNRFDSLTWQYPHNTLSIQWSAEAFLKAYKLFNDNELLDKAEYCLNILSLYQQAWSPPFLSFYAFGGFGVQNTDAEWSDARQAQFAETYLDFFTETGKTEYLQRGIAACRASFALMDIPENSTICPLNYKGTDYNGEFQGAMAENFGHSGYNERSGQSGFHWGTGSALTTAAIFRKQLGDIFVDGQSGLATGIDGIIVRQTVWGDTIKLVTDQLPGLTRFKVYTNTPRDTGKYVLIGESIAVTELAGNSKQE